MKKTTLLACATALTASSLAGAANFDFNKFGGGYSDSLDFVEDGIGINVTALGGSKVSWTSEGLGRGTNGFNYKMANGEGLSFTFTEAVDIGTMDVIGASSGNISWTAASGETGVFSNATDDADVGLINITSLSLISNGNYITLMGINDVFATSVSEVPVPGAAWLFGSALLGLAGVAKKRR